MIILDANVVSEPLRPLPDPNVIAWLDDQIPERLYIPSMVIGEILFGVASLPAGRRKNSLSNAYNELLGEFEGRIVPFDEVAARHWAAMNATAARMGRPLGIKDGIIAATAAARGFAVATRNTADFDFTGVQCINPWLYGSASA
ncbi:MAG: type II toxin-antitoxin system VapC family toxin [Cellulomonadaceae bacterium]|nr:type II toxin-antitoxin system VapC family toxin [Cellulomonadaceae bacterium]